MVWTGLKVPTNCLALSIVVPTNCLALSVEVPTNCLALSVVVPTNCLALSVLVPTNCLALSVVVLIYQFFFPGSWFEFSLKICRMSFFLFFFFWGGGGEGDLAKIENRLVDDFTTDHILFSTNPDKRFYRS